jgi:signal transduction histidine kinase
VGKRDTVARWLVDPSSKVGDPVEAGSARLLAACLLVSIGGFACLDAYLALTRVDHAPPPVGYPVLFASYALSRSARPRWGAALTTAMFALVPALYVTVGGGAVSLTFACVAPVVAGVFLGRGAVAMAGVAGAISLAAVPVLTGGRLTLEEVSTPVVAVVLTTTFSLLHKVHRDWVERARVEEIARQEIQVRQLQKMEAINRFAGGIAHDFNNLLAVVTGSTELLRRKGATGEVDMIDTAIGSARDLTAQLLTMSREAPLGSSATSPSDVVPKIGALLERVIGADVHTSIESERDLGEIRMSAGELEQILLNLATNARDAMPRGGTFELRAREADGGVVLSARDTGIGMDEATRQRVFEPFFSTKAEGQGTGLGLSVVYGIVTQAGGTVHVDSEPDAGTRFHIWLPYADREERVSDIRQRA